MDPRDFRVFLLILPQNLVCPLVTIFHRGSHEVYGETVAPPASSSHFLTYLLYRKPQSRAAVHCSFAPIHSIDILSSLHSFPLHCKLAREKGIISAHLTFTEASPNSFSNYNFWSPPTNHPPISRIQENILTKSHERPVSPSRCQLRRSSRKQIKRLKLHTESE